jgi:flagellar biosynthesis/type III secretory pathway chaperone
MQNLRHKHIRAVETEIENLQKILGDQYQQLRAEQKAQLNAMINQLTAQKSQLFSRLQRADNLIDHAISYPKEPIWFDKAGATDAIWETSKETKSKEEPEEIGFVQSIVSGLFGDSTGS